MKKILMVGFSRVDYITSIKQDKELKDYELICVYNRKLTEKYDDYIGQFDATYTLTEFKEQIENIAGDIEAVSCTQERDIVLYIDLLLLLGRIDTDTYNLYNKTINKKGFKDTLSTSHPDLVPKTWTQSDIENINYPVVGKPDGLGGSSYVQKLDNKDQLLTYIHVVEEELTARGKKEYGNKPINIIFESYESGPQYSINVYINKNSEIVFCPIIRVIPALEIGHNDNYSALQYPADELTTEMVNELQNKIKTVVDTFKIKNTSAHFDCVYTSTGFKFFEVGLRIGGLRQELFDLGFNFNHFSNDIKNRLGISPKINEPFKKICIVQKAAHKTGLLKKYSTPELRENEEKLHKIPEVGKEVMPVQDGGATLVRYIISSDNDVLVRAVTLFNQTKFEII